MKKITGLLKEYVFGLSIISMIIGLFLLFMGIIFYWISDIELGFYTDIIKKLDQWNAFILVGGLIIFGIGLYYLYSYQTNRAFVLEEIKTNKRSEFLKKHKELKGTVKHLPSKYQKMVKDKEKELKIK
ncbi:MAG: hypothetical protein LN364_00275 [Candidatus Thermoplasmatota archaeon]|nr:hypothetical protein [Candidatus Thermoplasmatota archaeon]